MEPKPPRMGVVGVGSMGQNHVRVLQTISRLIGIADIDEDRGDELSRRFGVRLFASHQALLDAGLEAAIIATPPETHYEIARDFLEAGVAVLVEKPLCTSSKQAAELVRISRRGGVTLGVGHIERHNPIVAFAKKALMEGRFGDLITISAKRVSSFPPRVQDIGVILDLGIHEVDIARHLVGSPAKRVFAEAGNHAQGEQEDHASIVLQFENGVTCLAEINWLTPMKVRKLALTCERNYVEVDYMNQSVTISSARLGKYDPTDLFQVPLEYDIREVRLDRREPLKEELVDFLDAVRTRRDPLVTGEDGLEVLRILEGALESARNGIVVDLT